MRPFRAACAITLALVGASCSKKAPEAPVPAPPLTVEVVKAAERSRHFEAVNQQLELGGDLYGYADIDGADLEVAQNLKGLFTNLVSVNPALAPYAKQDYGALFKELGLDDIKAAGLSSVRMQDGRFRNRTFFYAPEGRHGLFAVLGGPSAPFQRMKLAPADADFYSESEIDLPSAYVAIKKVVAEIAGEKAGDDVDSKLKEEGAKAGFSILEVIEGLKGRWVSVVRIDPNDSFKIPGATPVIIPSFSALVAIDGIGSSVEQSLATSHAFIQATVGDIHVFQLSSPCPVGGLQPVLAVQGTTLYAATTESFLMECLKRTSGLDQNPDFTRGLAALGSVGNGVTYVTPRFFRRIRDFGNLNPDLKPEARKAIDALLAHLPAPDQSLMTVRSNLPNGILIRSYWNRSLKQDLAMVALYNPVTVGLVAAMAIPAFQKVRANSQQTAILKNLRQLSAAADQYYLEHGVKVTSYDQLVGPGKLIEQITSVAGENYASLQFRQGYPLRIRLPDGRSLSYPFNAPNPSRSPRSSLAPVHPPQ